jgi:hypothetical protein
MTYSYDRRADKAIRLTPKELGRAEKSTTTDGRPWEYTVVVRPQAGGKGGYMVAVVKIDGNEGHLMGRPYTRYVETSEQIPEAVKDVMRTTSKMGFPGDMGDASRHRNY